MAVIILNTSESAYVDQNFPDSSFNDTVLSTNFEYDSSYENINTRYAFLKFSGWPEGRVISYAQLDLYFTQKSSHQMYGGFAVGATANHETPMSPSQIPFNSIPAYIPRASLQDVDIIAGVYNAFPLLTSGRTPVDALYSLVNCPMMLEAYGDYISSQQLPAYLRFYFHSSTGANKPQITLDVYDVTPIVTSLTPASGYVDRTADTIFSWGLTYDNPDNSLLIFGTLRQSSAEFRWRVAGAPTYETIAVGANGYVTVPANTFPEGQIQWQVVATSVYGVASDPTDWAEITTVDAAAVAVPVSPKSVYINGEEINTFTWSHSTTTGTSATRTDLQCSTNGSSWTDLATVTGSALTTTVAANTFSTGKLYWRVRTYNSNGIAGAWSTAVECYVLAPVPVPTISSVTSGTARPTFTWTATTQNAFELDILQSGAATIKSGVIVSADKSYKLGGFLPDGSHTARLRVYDGNGNYSEWATYDFTVSTTKPTTPTLSVEKSGNNLAITVSGMESGNMCYLLRDGKPISKAESAGEDITFTDDKTASEHAYIARNISPTDAYSDSPQVSAAPNVKGYVLSNGSETVNLKFRTNITDDFSNIGGSAHYSGGEYPNFDFSEFSDNSLNLGFSIPRKDQSDLIMLESIIKAKELTFVKSNYGNEMYCKITGYSKDPTKLQTEVTISFIRVNHSEVISYD